MGGICGNLPWIALSCHTEQAGICVGSSRSNHGWTHTNLYNAVLNSVSGSGNYSAWYLAIINTSGYGLKPCHTILIHQVKLMLLHHKAHGTT